MNTSVNIITSDIANKKSTKAISNINPEVSNDNLKQAAQLFTAISTNTYQDANRIITMSVDEEYNPPVTKIEPTLTLDKNYGTITYNGDGQLFALLNANYQYILNDNNLTVRNSEGTITSSYSITIYASEGTNYAAKTFTF